MMNAHFFVPLLKLVTILAAGVIFWRAEAVINLMGRTCRLPIRAAFWLLAVGSATLMLFITQGYRPAAPVTLLLIGAALLLVGERRIKGLLRIHSPQTNEKRVRI